MNFKVNNETSIFKNEKNKNEVKMKWGSESIEEEFNYLGYLFRHSNNHTRQTKQGYDKAITKMKALWKMARRKFQGTLLFNSIIINMILYGDKI